MTDLHDDFGDELRKALGQVVINFSNLEYFIGFFIAQIMIKARGSSDLKEINFQFHLAMTITAELPFYKLLTMLSSLHKHIETKRDKINEFEELLNQAGGAANQRDKLIHSTYFPLANEQGSIRVKSTAKKQKNQLINLKTDIQRTRIEEINAVAALLWQSYVKINNFMLDNGHVVGRNQQNS
jgi:hypothetical protein